MSLLFTKISRLPRKQLAAPLISHCRTNLNLSQIKPQDAVAAETLCGPDPFASDDYFETNKLVNLEDLFKARVHLGHAEGTLNDHMRPYIFGKRLGVHILDLDQTVTLMKQALNITAHIAFRSGIILFVNKSRQTGRIVEKTALECGEYAQCRAWRQGAFTNSERIFKAVTRLPDLFIFFNTLDNKLVRHTGVKNAAKMLIPSIGIVDTNCDPTLISYPVPGNDDTPQSIELYCKLFKQAVLNGKQKRLKYIESYGQDMYNKLLN